MSHCPICVHCRKAMTAELNDVFAVLGDTGRMCDKWRCKVCGQEVLVGFAEASIDAVLDEELFQKMLRYSIANTEVIYWKY